MNDHLIYLASPYNHPDEKVRWERYWAAVRAAGWLLKQGRLVYSPIVHNHPIAGLCDLPLGFEQWQALDEGQLSRCQSMLILTIDGWQQSKGIANETAVARYLEIPIQLLHPVAGSSYVTEEVLS